MTIILYDLQGADGERVSPACWRTQFALWHKGLEHTVRPLTFLDIPSAAGGGHNTLPVIEDGSKAIGDSWDIANYLEEAYPDRPSLFGSPEGRSYALLMNSVTSSPSMYLPLVRLLALEGFSRIAESDRVYYRQSREGFFGCTLEQLCDAPEDELLQAFRQGCEPLRQILQVQPFFSGPTPLYPDYVAVSTFVWARSVSSKRLVASDDPISLWLYRMLDLYGGAARRTKAYW